MKLLRLLKLAGSLTVPLALGTSAAHAQEPRFDGTRNVVMTCPPHSSAKDEALGYTHRFTAQVLNNRLTGTRGTEGEPGWHFLHGNIEADGSALLRLEGVVNNLKHAINNAPQGKKYTYQVKAQFDANAGEGQRTTSRVCHFKFNRR